MPRNALEKITMNAGTLKKKTHTNEARNKTMPITFFIVFFTKLKHAYVRLAATAALIPVSAFFIQEF